ncbi:MAG: hypothetical protein UH853_04185, partial [Muribaculaceae bacterium]|nr:hypothetical protein [Muribaculaceae bacterium]
MYWITMNNDLLPQARYTFNDKGQIVFEEDTPEEVKNGIVAENDIVVLIVFCVFWGLTPKSFINFVK